MNADASFGWDLLVVLAAGGALALLVLLARQAFELAPLARARRERLAQLGPVFAVLAGLVYALWAVRRLFGMAPGYVPVGVALVIAAFVLAAWPAVRDLIAGVFLKAGRVCKVGDQVRIGEVHGRVARMGHRVLVVETHDGEEAVLPYSRVARAELRRAPALGGPAPHVFQLEAPSEMPLAEVKAVVKRNALLVHWAAVGREPELSVDDGGALEVTVYAIDPDRGADIERAVRQALTSGSLPQRTTRSA